MLRSSHSDFLRNVCVSCPNSQHTSIRENSFLAEHVRHGKGTWRNRKHYGTCDTEQCFFSLLVFITCGVIFGKYVVMLIEKVDVYVQVALRSGTSFRNCIYIFRDLPLI